MNLARRPDRFTVSAMDDVPSKTRYPDDAALLARLRDGDRDAFRDLVIRHGGRMFAAAQRIVDPDEAWDCVQEGFLQAHRKIHTFKGNSALSTWLHRIAVNAALSRIRKRSHQNEVLMEDLMPVFDDTGCRVEPSYTRLDDPDPAEQTEMRLALVDAVSQLPEEFREIVLLRDVQELNTEETAEELGISVAAVRTRLHRARAALKKMLEPAYGAEMGSPARDKP